MRKAEEENERRVDTLQEMSTLNIIGKRQGMRFDQESGQDRASMR